MLLLDSFSLIPQALLQPRLFILELSVMVMSGTVLDDCRSAYLGYEIDEIFVFGKLADCRERLRVRTRAEILARDRRGSIVHTTLANPGVCCTG